MKATAWNNGKHHASGAGYGIKISRVDRDKYFNKKWKYIYISLPGVSKKILVNVDKSSFWNDPCRELIKKEIGIWLISNKFAPWALGNPPVFDVKKKHDNYFELLLK